MFKFIKSKKLYLISLLIAFLIIFGLQYFSYGHYSDPDGFYHAKTSQLLAQGQLTAQFKWLPLTTWGNGFANQHYLYHLALIPFNDMRFLQVSVALFALAFFGFFLVVLSKLNVTGIVWWTILLLLGSVDFLFRINLVKANTLSLVLMFTTVLFLLSWQKRQVLLKVFLIAVTSFVFVWTYGGFVFLPIIVGTYSLVVLISKRKFDYIPALSVGVGIGLGLLLHPHHTNLVPSLLNQLFQTGLGAGSVVPAGNEWLPYNFDWFVKSNLILLFVWIVSLGVTIKKIIVKGYSWEILWTQIMAIIFFVLALTHRRFIEYYVPFAVLASAVAIGPYLANIKLIQIKEAFYNFWQFRVAILIVIFGVAISFGYNTFNVATIMKAGTSQYHYKEAAQTIEAISQDGDMVLNTQWDQFPQLWYWNSKNYYMAGMDPTFMYIKEPDKYWKWRIIADDDPTSWENVDEIYRYIKDDLQSRYIFIETERNPNIIVFLDQNPQIFELIYNTQDILVYKVKGH